MDALYTCLGRIAKYPYCRSRLLLMHWHISKLSSIGYRRIKAVDSDKTAGSRYISTCSGWRACSSCNELSGEHSLRSRSTIFAAASGNGKCGVVVFRISGSQAYDTLRKVALFKESIEPRKAYLRKLYHPISRLEIDHGIVLWFPGPHSFTGEDCVELQVHGGKAVVLAIVDALSSIPGFRYAEAGEFCKRSFENGKLDLTQIEGLADLLDAETEAQRKQALKQLDGSLRLLYSSWKETLLRCTAHVEAYIDFSEEEHFEGDLMEIVCRRIVLLETEIKRHLVNGRCSERVRNGVRVAIVGEPNVGKSSLFNLLCQRPAAIVSSVAGTTRDVIEVSLIVAGFPIIISDTAGLHQTTEPIEAEGVRRAIRNAAQADIILVVIDGSDTSIHSVIVQKKTTIEEFIAKHMRQLGLTSLDSSDGYSVDRKIIVLLNKMDLLDDSKQKLLLDFSAQSRLITTCLMSCEMKHGIQEFLRVFQDKVCQLCTLNSTECIGVSQARHGCHLVNCLAYLHAFTSLHATSDIVLAAQALRSAMYQISKIMGHVTSDDILKVIFKDFCIGK